MKKIIVVTLLIFISCLTFGQGGQQKYNRKTIDTASKNLNNYYNNSQSHNLGLVNGNILQPIDSSYVNWLSDSSYIGLRNFSSKATYTPGMTIWYGDTLYKDSISTTGAFNKNKWKREFVRNNNAAYLPLSGGTMSGNIVMSGAADINGTSNNAITFGNHTINLFTNSGLTGSPGLFLSAISHNWQSFLRLDPKNYILMYDSGYGSSMMFDSLQLFLNGSHGTNGQVPTIDAHGHWYYATPAATGVTSFSSGNLSPLFTTSVSNPTTTPVLSFSLTNQGADVFLRTYYTGSSQAPFYGHIYAKDINGLNDSTAHSFTLTTTGTSGAATYSGNVLNIPQYSGINYLQDTIGGSGTKPTLITQYYLNNTFSGSTHITTLGTIVIGTWNAGIISPTYGGTGVNNGTNTLTWASSLNFGSSAKGYAYNHGNGIFTYDTTRVGTINGSGVSGQITYWNGTSSITGSVNHTYSDGVYDQLNFTSGTGTRGMQIFQSSSDAHGPKLFFLKERGTLSSPTTVLAGDTDLHISAASLTTSRYNGNRIIGSIDKAVSAGIGTHLDFYTASVSGGSLLGLRIDSGQNLIPKNPIKAKYLSITDSLANVNSVAGSGGITTNTTTGAVTVTFTGHTVTDSLGSDSNSLYINCFSGLNEVDTVYRAASGTNDGQHGVKLTASFNNFIDKGKATIWYRKLTTKYSQITFPASHLQIAYTSHGTISGNVFTFPTTTSTSYWKITIEYVNGTYNVAIVEYSL